MAVTSTPIDTTGQCRSWDITATADSDTTTGNITHGLVCPNNSANDVEIRIEPLSAQASLSGWYISGRTTTTFALTKGTATGSGNGSPQIRVYAYVRHSIDQ
jgi:hypothetical protein